jgi:hypothetical protein
MTDDEKVYSVDEVNHLISEMDKVIAKLKTENAALRERLEKYKISFKKVYMDFFSKLNLDKDFRKRFDNETTVYQKLESKQLLLQG